MTATRQTIINKTIVAGETPDKICVDSVRSLAIQTNYDVVTPGTKTFDSGAFEVDTLTFADKATSAHGDYVSITDTNGTKWAVALSKAGIAEVTSITTIGEGSVKEVTSITTVGEGSVKNVTQVVTNADVSGSLAGDYFVVGDGAATTVGVWFSVDGVPAVAPTTGADRDVEVELSENDSDEDVAAAISTAFTLDAGLVVANVAEVVTMTDVAFGARTAAVDGVAPNNTEFAITTEVEGHDSDLHQKFFVAYNSTGSVGVWFDIDNAGADTPAGVALLDNAVKITTVSSGDDEDTVATQVAAALDSALWAATATDNVVTATNDEYGAFTDALDGDTGFTISTTTQGADSALDGKFFILGDVDGTVAFWFDVGNTGTVAPVHGATRAVEITTISVADNAATVAGKVRTAIDADSKFDVGTLTDATFTAICKDLKSVANGNAGDSGFTVSTTTQGADLGLPPTGAIWTSIAAAKKAQADISGATTDANVATAVRAVLAALTGIAAVITVGAASGADIPLTHVVKGPVANPVPKNTGDTGVGTITVAETLAGAVSEVNVDADTLTIPSHGFTTGAIVTLTTTGTLPAGLATATDYTVKVVDANTIQLLDAGVLVDITDEGSSGAVNTVTHTALAGCSVQYQKSNDGINWFNEGSAVTIAGDGANLLEIDEKAYPFLQAVISLTSGVVALEIIVCGQ